MADKRMKIIIAGGKTGGHLFPGIAVAQAINRLESRTDILFVGTDTPFEINTLERYGFSHKGILSSGIKGKGILDKLKSLMQIPVSMVQAFNIIRTFSPDMVLGVGGYASGPLVLTAKLMGIATAIQEQNTIPGITNRLLSHVADVIFTAFKETRGFDALEKSIYTGNPIRNDGAGDTRNMDKNFKGFTLLVTGGSQGAASINRAVIKAVKLMEHPDRLRIIHQTGTKDEAWVLEEYRALGLSPQVKAFFRDLPRYQTLADLIVCRAGAGTVSEITAKGKPSLLIPYPYAADDHQRFNAEALVREKAGLMILDRELDGHLLKNTIMDLVNDPARLSKMARAAKSLGTPDADKIIAATCLKVAKGKKKSHVSG